ncbi:D-2-hydroxyacid dehydrogenase family protein [Chondromyces apiculatus]
MADWPSLAPRAEATFFHDVVSDVDALVERLAPFDILVLMRERTQVGADLIARLPRLALITTMGTRNAAIDLGAARARGIVVSGTEKGPHAELATPTLAWGLVLALTRGIVGQATSVRQGGWQREIGVDIEGKTLGLLGLGRIGRQVARFGQAFGMTTIAWSQNLTDEAAASAGVRRVDKDTLFAASDVLSVHLVLSGRSRGLVDDAALRRMKPTAYLVNTSRGPIVDEAALLSALTERRIAGAALDVFDAEPLPQGHPFRTLDNVLATPHIGYVTENGYRSGYGQMVEDIRAFLDGRPIRVLGDDATWR